MGTGYSARRRSVEIIRGGTGYTLLSVAPMILLNPHDGYMGWVLLLSLLCRGGS